MMQESGTQNICHRFKWFGLALVIILQSMIGHCLGAAGGLEAIATIKALTTGYVHPTINQFVRHHVVNICFN